MQIIQSNQESPATIRQRALDQAMGNILGGIQSMQTAKTEAAKTKRQEALAAQKIDADLAQSGMERFIKPQEQVTEAAPEGVMGKIGAFFKSAPEAKSPEYGYKYMASKEAQMAAEKAKKDAELAQKAADTQLEKDKFKLAERKTNAEIAKMNSDTIGAKDPAKRLAKMSGEVQGKVAGISSALDALSGMGKAVSAGDGPSMITSKTPLIGRAVSDTPFTQNQNVVNEVVGRLQSGGAITSDELESFTRMGPRWGDSPDIQQSKLAQQKAFLENKLVGFGIKPDEMPQLGFRTTESQMGSIGQPIRQAIAMNPVKSKQGFNPSAKMPGVMPTAQAAAVQPKHIEAVKGMSDQDLLNFINQK